MCFKFIIHLPLLDTYRQYFLSLVADWFTCEIWINLITKNNVMELYAKEHYIWDSAAFVASIICYFASSCRWEHHMKVELEAMREERRFFWKKVKEFTLLGLNVGTTRSSSLHHCGSSVGLTCPPQKSIVSVIFLWETNDFSLWVRCPARHTIHQGVG